MSVGVPPDVYDALVLVESMPGLDFSKDTKEILHYFERYHSYQCAVDWILDHPEDYERGITEGFAPVGLLEPSDYNKFF